MAVELHRGDTVNGLAAAGFADPVVAAGGFEFSVREQFTKNLDRNTGISVTLGVAVPVGVEHGLGFVVFDAVGVVQHGHSVDPGAVGEREGKPGDRAAPAGVAPVGGQQLELADRGVRVACPNPLLLGEDHLGGLLADRQPACGPVGLVVVIDQHGLPVVVSGQAVEVQIADLFGAAAGVDSQLDRAEFVNLNEAPLRGIY
ncbi:hypothetical protein A9W98_01140 [Mycobacterium gordonae]|uniref:Uncharacterized protein n=1 Tax=Mycobacterium gordonae TaxID=1778 RepID=A0A1A6BJP6_MYCGO|nr:hypothetical protein A9W98_01140 [Mycobacterium gordonae]